MYIGDLECMDKLEIHNYGNIKKTVTGIRTDKGLLVEDTHTCTCSTKQSTRIQNVHVDVDVKLCRESLNNTQYCLPINHVLHSQTTTTLSYQNETRILFVG